ncbi:hypothetical protein EYR40_008388 [Pleurotus pulmonarius]|nr:hypothetical protein EYR40_008388 [Pleurotus pulmonarius]
MSYQKLSSFYTAIITMNEEEQKTTQTKATNELHAITSETSVDNELVPPLGTVYYSCQTITIFDNATFILPVLGRTPMTWGTVSWSSDVYTYGTGGVPPTDDDFAHKGGLIYLVTVHRVTVSAPSFIGSEDSWGTMKFSLDWHDPDLRPVYQLPSTGSEVISGGSYNYEIDFLQAMQMLKDSGNQETTFNARYKQTFSLIQAKQTGVAASGAEFQIKTTGDTREHDFTQTYSLSMLTHPNPSQFPISINAQFKIDLEGTIDHATLHGGFMLDLNF